MGARGCLSVVGTLHRLLSEGIVHLPIAARFHAQQVWSRDRVMYRTHCFDTTTTWRSRKTPNLLTAKSQRIAPSISQVRAQASGVGFSLYRLCVPAVILTIGSENWGAVQETYESLVRDLQWKVRRTLSFSLHEVVCLGGALCSAFNTPSAVGGKDLGNREDRGASSECL